MGEDKRGACDVADFARAGGDVLEGAPALGEQGEPAFAQAAQGPLDGVAGAGIDIQFPAAWGLFDRNQDAGARAVISGVGQGGQPSRGSGIQRREGMGAAVRSCTEPGSASETHSGNPSGAHTAWTLPPWACAFPEYHRSMTSPLTLTAGSLHRSQGMIFPSKITWETPSSLARSSASRSSGASSASTATTSSR